MIRAAAISKLDKLCIQDTYRLLAKNNVTCFSKQKSIYILKSVYLLLRIYTLVSTCKHGLMNSISDFLNNTGRT